MIGCLLRHVEHDWSTGRAHFTEANGKQTKGSLEVKNEVVVQYSFVVVGGHTGTRMTWN